MDDVLYNTVDGALVLENDCLTEITARQYIRSCRVQLLFAHWEQGAIGHMLTGAHIVADPQWQFECSRQLTKTKRHEMCNVGLLL
jgi:hypothetical protein